MNKREWQRLQATPAEFKRAKPLPHEQRTQILMELSGDPEKGLAPMTPQAVCMKHNITMRTLRRVEAWEQNRKKWRAFSQQGIVERGFRDRFVERASEAIWKGLKDPEMYKPAMIGTRVWDVFGLSPAKPTVVQVNNNQINNLAVLSDEQLYARIGQLRAAFGEAPAGRVRGGGAEEGSHPTGEEATVVVAEALDQDV